MFFLHISSSMSKYVKGQSGVKYILEQYVSGPVWTYHTIVRSFYTIVSWAT